MGSTEHVGRPARKAPGGLLPPVMGAARGRNGPMIEVAGGFEVRLAAGPDEVWQAQRLRFDVFFGEGGAAASGRMAQLGRDICPLDDVCDHLVVADATRRDPDDARRPRIVGTYRLLRRAVAERHGGFYSQGEFDLAPLLRRHPRTRFLELGRSCVHPDYRSRRVIELLWRGLWLYARHHDADCLIGCASLPGADLEANRLALSFLHHHAPSPAPWQVAPRAGRSATFAPLPAVAVDPRRGAAALPPLVKAYLRAGAHFGEGVVLDHQFGTTDVFAVMPVAEIAHRYLRHYGRPSCLSGTSAA